MLGKKQVEIKRFVHKFSVVISWMNERSILMGRCVKFDEFLKLLEEYKKEYGHCNVPQDHKTESGVPLGEIVSNIRKGSPLTTFEEKAKLNEIGFVWRVEYRKK